MTESPSVCLSVCLRVLSDPTSLVPIRLSGEIQPLKSCPLLPPLLINMHGQAANQTLCGLRGRSAVHREGVENTHFHLQDQVYMTSAVTAFLSRDVLPNKTISANILIN